jgi:hypothetical protein
MILVFIHGWSVTNTDTYGGLPAALLRNAASAKLALEAVHIHLGKYVSFANEVRMDDLARGLQQALGEQVLPALGPGEKFACITHSTGGPVVRSWMDLFFRDKLDRCPLSHLVMLAPANHGSALAQLGKAAVSKVKFFLEGVQPGLGVLDWLELGSTESWDLNFRWLDARVPKGLYVFVLVGQTIDRKLYDVLNSYTDEQGSDGVVRVASANLNYGLVSLVQGGDGLQLKKQLRAPKTAFGVVPGRSHSGTNLGIMASVAPADDGSHPTVAWVLRCLAVSSAAAYTRVSAALDELTAKTQADERSRTETELFLIKRKFITDRYSMLVCRLTDDRGNQLNDYDLMFTAGPEYDPNHLPPGFFVDRQRNLRNPGKLTYYIDYDVRAAAMATPVYDDKFGFKIVARPTIGFAYYDAAVYQGTFTELRRYFEPNQTLMIDIQLKRNVDTAVVDLTTVLHDGDGVVASPIAKQPGGKTLP